MAINKQNYEAWFLDYAEGNLSEKQIAELLLFLEKNPALRAEFEEEFEVLPLQPENLPYGAAEELKREQQVGFITLTNYEEYLIGAAEGDLTPAEQAELQRFLKQNPQLEDERAVYAGIGLEADTHITFPNKENLKKQEGITAGNYEDYLIGSVEGDLNAEQEEELANYLAANPEVATEREMYAQIHLNPDIGIHFPNKEALKHKSGRVFPLYMRYAAAAAAVVVIMLTIFYQGDTEGIVPEVANIIEEDTSDNAMPQLVTNVRPHTERAQGMPNEHIDVPQPHNQHNQYVVQQDEKEQWIPEQPEEQIADDTPQLELPGEEPKQEIEEPIEPELIPEIPDENIAQVTANEKITLWQYAGMEVKENVLKQENVTDGKIRENDVVKGVSKAVDAVTNAPVLFADNSTDETIDYGFSVGKFSFKRTRPKK